MSIRIVYNTVTIPVLVIVVTWQGTLTVIRTCCTMITDIIVTAETSTFLISKPNILITTGIRDCLLSMSADLSPRQSANEFVFAFGLS